MTSSFVGEELILHDTSIFSQLFAHMMQTVHMLNKRHHASPPRAREEEVLYRAENFVPARDGGFRGKRKKILNLRKHQTRISPKHLRTTQGLFRERGLQQSQYYKSYKDRECVRYKILILFLLPMGPHSITVLALMMIAATSVSGVPRRGRSHHHGRRTTTTTTEDPLKVANLCI